MKTKEIVKIILGIIVILGVPLLSIILLHNNIMVEVGSGLYSYKLLMLAGLNVASIFISSWLISSVYL